MGSERSVLFFTLHPFPIVLMPKSLSLTILSASVLALSACATTTHAPTVDQSGSSSMDMMQSSSMSSVSAMVIELGSSSSASLQSSVMSQKSSTKTEKSSVAVQQSSSAKSEKVAIVRVIPVQVKNFAFVPNVITVKKGEKVQLQLTGIDGHHGFAIPDLNINVRVDAGQTVTVDLPTDKAGSFDAFCSVPCGPGHMNMKATVVIQ